MLDIVSRCVVGWMPAMGESASLAERLLANSIRKQRVERQQLTIRADRGSSFDRPRAEAVVAQFKSTRSDEYAEIAREAGRLLQHVARETEHRDFSFSELEELEEDLSKVKRWIGQVKARDYFPNGSSDHAEELLARCDEALAEFVNAAAARDTPHEMGNASEYPCRPHVMSVAHPQLHRLKRKLCSSTRTPILPV